MSATVEALHRKYGADRLPTELFRDNLRVFTPAEILFDVMKTLKEQHGFDMLAEIAGVDYLQYPKAKDRYGVIYGLTNITTGERLFIKVMLNDPDPTVDSVYPLWKGADWMEREVYDMFGITFKGHPDLRRILLPPEFVSFPLRKDYPMRGKGERHNFPTVTRAES
jgi:NADH-quinone oxidoreductase subunit C